jgi:hypothetical protein
MTRFITRRPRKKSLSSHLRLGAKSFGHMGRTKIIYSAVLKQELGLRFGADEFFESQGRDIKFQLD